MPFRGIYGVNYLISAAVKCAVLIGCLKGLEKHYRNYLITSLITQNSAREIPIKQYIFISNVGYQYIIISTIRINILGVPSLR